MSNETRSFRVSLTTLYLVSIAWVNGILAVALGLWTVLTIPPDGWGRSVEGMVVAMTATALIELAYCAMIVYLLPAKLEPDGLRVVRVGARRVIPWAAVVRVRPFNLGGLRFLLLTTEATPKTFWVPLFVRDKAGYLDAVAEFAGDDHLLTQALRAHLGVEE